MSDDLTAFYRAITRYVAEEARDLFADPEESR